MPKSYAEHTLDIYDTYTLFVTQTARGWREISKRLGDQLPTFAARDGGHTRELIFKPNKPAPNQHFIVIYVNPYYDERQRIQTCAHEAVHAGLMIANRIDMGNLLAADREGQGENEPIAYLIGWITTWLHDNTHSIES